MLHWSKNFLDIIFTTSMENAGNWIYQKLRQVHHILHNATVFGVSLLVLVLSGIVLQHLAIKKSHIKGKNNYCWELNRTVWLEGTYNDQLVLCGIAQALLILRLPVSHHTAWLSTGNAGVFQLALGVSARFTIPTAVKLTLLWESSILCTDETG